MKRKRQTHQVPESAAMWPYAVCETVRGLDESLWRFRLWPPLNDGNGGELEWVGIYTFDYLEESAAILSRLGYKVLYSSDDAYEWWLALRDSMNPRLAPRRGFREIHEPRF